MKKLIILLLCFNILSMPAFCAITDDFAEKTLDKSLKIKQAQSVKLTDDFAENTLDKNLKIKTYSTTVITDNFAENNKNKNPKQVKTAPIQEFLPKKIETKQVVVQKTNQVSDYRNPVTVKIKNSFSTRQSVEEGDFIEFITTRDAVINKTKFPAGTTVNARVENISLNKSMGVPADLVIGNFSINGKFLKGEINKTGANRTLWVRPCVVLFTCAFFGSGILFIPIRGGHAKISPYETFTLYAE